MFRGFNTAVRIALSRSSEPGGLPVYRQLLEMVMLLASTGLGPGNYDKYRLWRNDIPWREKKGYWHDQKYYNFLNKVNPKDYRIVARNKVIAKSLMRFYGIPDAQYLGYLSRNASVDASGNGFIEPAELLYAIGRKRPAPRICFKPVDGSGGEGFCAAEFSDDGAVRLRRFGRADAKPINEFIQQELLVADGVDYVIEQYIDQHAALAELNPSSLNTLRVWIGKPAVGPSDIIGLYLRVGRAGSLVDNRIAGGFGLAVDQETFRTTFGLRQDCGNPYFTIHPDSGILLSDRQLPFKEEVISLSHSVMNVLPSAGFAGLDIGISPDGPILVEFNLAPTPNGACVLQKSHESLLGHLI